VRAREVTARRYAKALFAAARDAGVAAAVSTELVAFQEAVAAHPEVRDVLSRPWIKAADRRGIALAIAERTGAGRLLRDFAGLVAERGRIDHLPEIAASYRALLDEDLGQARVEVRTRVALSPEDRRRLGARLAEILGKRIILEEQVDHTLLGGFIARVGSLILDGSLDGQLGRMRERLAGGSS
jgi:F-type H+-transporting ATPase subunit delta